MRTMRSMLYIPGNSPGMIQNAAVFGADMVMIDLEDAVALSEKDAARDIAAGFLRDYDFGDLPVVVRINGADTPHFEADLEAIVPLKPFAVRLPKCQSPADVTTVDARMGEIEGRFALPVGAVPIHAMLESALGIENAYAIATASSRVKALTLGGQDLTADLGIQKTRDGWEFFYARSRVVMAAKAAGIDAFDTVWTDFNDPEGLLRETRQIVELGFTGKAAIHPSQVEIIHRAFRPDAKEVRKAERIVAAALEAERQGRGVVAVDGKMVDGPIIARARHLIDLAGLYGMEGGEAR
ncbi:MAG: CoA ester lyase [Synergistales bacterium]